jgi:acetyl-CoA C-acetyltransferase
MGTVVQAEASPARRCSICWLPDSVACTTVNKVCASGMKAVMFATCIQSGDAEIEAIMENMSLIPHYTTKKRNQIWTSHHGRYIKDGLIDAYDNSAMGVCADLCATDYNIVKRRSR